MSYRVITSCDIISFHNQIHTLLEEGWELHGSVSTALAKEDNDPVIYYSQALTYVKTFRDLENENKNQEKLF